MRTVGLIIQNARTPAESAFVCPVCGREYKTEAARDKHITEKHPDYKPDSEE